VAEGGGLENRCAGNRAGGSNPSSSVLWLQSIDSKIDISMIEVAVKFTRLYF
jgi:hypothetical protein